MLFIKTSDGTVFSADSLTLDGFFNLRRTGDNFVMEKNGYSTVVFFNQVVWVSNNPTPPQ